MDRVLDIEGAVAPRSRASAKEREDVLEAVLEDLVGETLVGQCA